MTTLSELLSAAKRKAEMSNRQIARRTSEVGQPVSSSTVDLYMNGRHGEPEDRVLRAFAEVLPVRLSQLRDAAGVPLGDSGPYTPPDLAHRLNPRQRRAVDELIRSMVEPDERTVTTDEQSTTTDAAAGSGGHLRVVQDVVTRDDDGVPKAAYQPEEPPAAEREQDGDDGGA